jgi:molecular chaperone DnaK
MMSRQKIDYGIDLGTTNSSIARMVNGQIEIVRSDEFLKDTTPSCILIKPKAIIAGDKAFNILGQENIEAFKTRSNKKQNTFAEFKRTMGTTTQYLASNRNASFSSEELSAEILKKLRNYVKDEDVDCAVITVPAKFRQNQLDATQKAAELAGFKYCELLQEPIAASLAYGINAEKAKGYWLVFDFGGGTFDAALMKVDQGIIKVVDTEGDNHLGGKNLDIAIVDEIIIPELAKRFKLEKVLSGDERGLLKSALKRIAEGIKIDLSAANKKVSTIQTDDQSIGNDDDEMKLLLMKLL